MTFTRIRRGVLGALLALPLLPATEVAAHGVSLDLHHPHPADSAFHRNFLAPWTLKIEQDAGGRMRFHPHPASTSGGETGLYDRVLAGEVDVAWTPIRTSPAQFPRMSVVEFPFTARRAQGASRAVSEFVRTNDLSDRDFDGVRLLAVHVGDGSQLHWGRALAEPPADVKGRRVAVATTGDAAMLAAMGAVPVEMPLPKMSEALSSGSVDGALLSWGDAQAADVDRAARSHTEFGPGTGGLTSSLFVLVMSAGSFGALPDDLKAVVNANSGADTAAWLGRVMDDVAAQARKAAVARGDAIRVLTQEERERWISAARTVANARIDALEQADVRVKGFVERLREQLMEFDAAD